MNDLNKIYQNLKQRNPKGDNRMLKQQAWQLRDKHIFENSIAVSSSAAAAGAAGAGAGGGTPASRRFQDSDYAADYFESDYVD
jgi:hypothetical protein